MNKRLVALILAALCVAACLPLSVLNASAKADFEIEVPYGHPTVDGVVSEGEYQVSYVMDKTTAAAWVGEVGDTSVTWYLAWDENGLYYAGTINDSTPTYRSENGHWVGIDCLELAVNPGEILEANDENQGVFFSFGATKTGGVVGFRHNFADGLVSDEITAKSSDHKRGKKSYTIELMIPWSLVQLDCNCSIGGKTDIHLDSTGFEPKAGAVLGLLPCAIDSHDDDHPNNISAAFKFNGTDFLVKDFIHAVLLAAPETEAETVPATEAVTEPATELPTEPVTETATVPATEAQTEDAASGCRSALSGTAAVAATAAAGVILKKKKER